jgi:hypothetical protein
MTNVVDFPGLTKEDVPVEQVLGSDEALSLDEVIVLGWKDDEMFFATSSGQVAEVNILLDLAKQMLIDFVLRGQG